MLGTEKLPESVSLVFLGKENSNNQSSLINFLARKTSDSNLMTST